MRVLKAVEEVNEAQKRRLFEKLSCYYQGELKGKTVALWGLAFKPETDDIREAPSMTLIELILGAGGEVSVYDPVAMEECRRKWGDRIRYGSDMYDTVTDADALLLVTEWKEFRLPSWSVVERLMRTPVLFDGRNIYDRNDFKESRITYYCIGSRSEKQD